MTDRGTPAPVEAFALIRDAMSSDDSGRVAGTFMRGLTLGALIGAAIAGSAIWQRHERRRHEAASAPRSMQDHP